MKQNFDGTRLNAHPSMIEVAPPPKIDLEWLRDEIRKLNDVRLVADGAHTRHDHGIVYAVRMAADDTQGLRWKGSMGIEAITPIPPCKIVSRIVVPSGYEVKRWGEAGDELLRRITDENGLVAALAARRSLTAS